MMWKARWIIDDLFHAAREGSMSAAEEVAQLLRGAVTQLSKLAESHPELLKPIARDSWKWPVMMSRHPLLCDDYKAILGRLNLGYEMPFYFDDRSKWRFDEFGKIALGLLFYVWDARKENREHFAYGAYGEAVDRLPEFRRGKNAAEWWEVAVAPLFCCYPELEGSHPNPDSIPELGGAVKLKQRIPSKVRDKILERIRQRFVNFAKP